jgi:transcriptional regulator with XRE-family HTH domain
MPTSRERRLDVSIGEALAQARRDAGLSVAEISSQTRVRQSIIDDIEHDDYSACGGDFYARGNIRAIAKALGVDSEPLIEAYDAARRPSGWISAAKPATPVTAAEAPKAFMRREESDSRVGEDTEQIPIRWHSDPVTVGEPPRPVTIGRGSHPIRPAETAEPAEPVGPARMTFADRRHIIWLELGVVLLALATLGGLLLVLGTRGQAARHPSVTARHLTGGHRTTQPAGSPQPLRRTRTAQALVPASITAFGPGGTSHGDNPQLAQQALAGNVAAPWHSDWYATADFGNLQSGTGLLLDMGRTVTIKSARIKLRDGSGTHLALRIGDSPMLVSLPTAARAHDAGRLVKLRMAPMRGRYVLVWFTRLPPDPAGTFQVYVYDIKLRGYP